MKQKVMIAPSHLKEIPDVYSKRLSDAGYELLYPVRNVQMTEQEVLDQMPGCLASLAGSEPYSRLVLEKLAERGLLIIARAGVGYDAVDLAAATEHGIVVTFAPGTNQDSVAEHTFMLLLAWAKNLIPQHLQVHSGQWPRKATRPLRQQTLGVLGLGRIGKVVARRGLDFGMTVWAYDPYLDMSYCQEQGIHMGSLEEVLRRADYLSLHMPTNAETLNLINRETLALMKPTALLINTSRGTVLNEHDLAEALRNHVIAGAALDVFADEPPVGSPLIGMDNVIVTAHTAGVDSLSRDDMARRAADAIALLTSGEWPEAWIVNPEVKEKFISRRSKLLS